jgi:hypothetical protein
LQPGIKPCATQTGHAPVSVKEIASKRNNIAQDAGLA